MNDDLYKEICRHPDDDTLRLAYADWLDENAGPPVRCGKCSGSGITYSGCGYESLECPKCDGSGSIADTGNRDRAEFIRLDVERHSRWPDFAAVCDADRPTTYEDGERLSVVEKRLLTLGTAHPEWSRLQCPTCLGTGAVQIWIADAQCDTCHGTGDLFLAPGVSGASLTPPPKPRTVTFARGFPDAVHCTLAEAFTSDGTPTPWACEVVRRTPVTRFLFVELFESAAKDDLVAAFGRRVRRNVYGEVTA